MSYKKLTQASGCSIFQKANEIFLTEQANKWTATTRYVFMLLTFIFGANGIFTFVMYMQNKMENLLFLLFLSVLVLLFGFLLFLIQRIRAKADRMTPDELKVFCIIDLDSKSLLSAEHSILAPLSQVKLSKQLSLSSSSPNLVINWPGGKAVIAKGNYFSGGIKPIIEELSEFISF